MIKKSPKNRAFSMSSPAEQDLETRLELARLSHDDEVLFFRHLLDARVYAHAPISDDYPRTRLIQFRHPDGFYAVPFFTSRSKALFASGPTIRIVQMTGRDLLQGSPGATFMLNPNDGGCVLYPEEVLALLKDGSVARVEILDQDDSAPLVSLEEANPPTWLMPTLMAVYMDMPFVRAAYLLELEPLEGASRFLVAIGVGPEHAERAVRASTTAIQTLCAEAGIYMDMATFNPQKGRPDYLLQRGVERFYGPQLN